MERPRRSETMFSAGSVGPRFFELANCHKKRVTPGKERLESVCRLSLRFRLLASIDFVFQAHKRLFEESYLRWPSFVDI